MSKAAEPVVALFDSHCHLDDPVFQSDWKAMHARMRQAGLKGAMVVGIDLKRSRRAVALAEAHSALYAAVGVHPHDAGSCSPQVLAALKKLARHPKVRAWGETGLDFNRMYSPHKDQESCFEHQLALGGELGLPFIFHERDSRGRFHQMLRTCGPEGLQGVVHCFSGNDQELDHYLQMGLYIGITGIVTLQKRGAHLREQVRRIPRDRLLIETDAPYLTPTPDRNRHRRNEPAFVRSVLFKLAAVRNEDPQVLARAVLANTGRLFGIKWGLDASDPD